eukprot:gb/GEZJ01002378.1/.p1 GENE.gb/GEZJ01002378.1/~~gb/GEZJ01002378.1/.p1  ORF type:complete len:206 (-),score=12.61 gb/GEZJ01002378.1/:253-870(-)
MGSKSMSDFNGTVNAFLLAHLLLLFSAVSCLPVTTSRPFIGKALQKPSFTTPINVQHFKSNPFAQILQLSALISPTPSPRPLPPPIMITCLPGDCRGGDNKSFLCNDNEMDILPDHETDEALMLYAEYDVGINTYVIRFRAQIHQEALQSGTIYPIPWISTENDVSRPTCFQVAYFGRPFGTCCRPCSYPYSHVRPPSLSCCSAC